MEVKILTVQEFTIKAKRLARALQAEQDRGQAKTGIIHQCVRGETQRLATRTEAGKAYLEAIRGHRVTLL